MRTDRHRVCTDCAVRYPAVSVQCPRCGRRRGYDARRRRDRRRALERLLDDAGAAVKAGSRAGDEGRDWLSDGLVFYVKWIVGPIALAVGIALAVHAGSFDWFVIGAIIGLLLQVSLVLGLALLASTLYLFAHFARSLGARSRREHERPDPPRIRVEVSDDAAPVARSPESSTRVRGRVRVAAPIASPLKHTPCAAFRVVGETAVGAVDDAGATSFTLITDAGDEIRIEGVASVEVPVPAAPTTVRPDDRLAEFLEARALYPERGPVQLAEAVIADGDEIEVEGVVVGTKTTAHGYRNTRATPTLADARIRPPVTK